MSHIIGRSRFALGLFAILLTLNVVGPRMHAIGADSEQTPRVAADSDSAPSPAVEAAREKAKLLHHIYVATLDTMHHYYFHVNKAVIPARAMEDIFADVSKETQSSARWISVNTKAMSVDHEPTTPFEKQAAVELAKGQADFELVDDKYYRRASIIPLTNGCIGCHVGHFAKPTDKEHYAGLVISIRLAKD